MSSTKKTKMIAAILAIVFVTYNVVFWAIAGFTDHEAPFWISYVFMLVAFGATATCGALMGQRMRFLRDWLFGYPVIKHCTIYIIAEFLASTIFSILADSVSWQLTFVVQLILLAIFLVFAISCFLAKTTMDEVRTKVKDKTGFIKLLRSDAEMLVEKCGDPALKSRLQKLAEAIRYSDPMSAEALFELEKELTLTVSECDKALVEQRYEDAGNLCEKATLLLSERNRKCKALK